MLEKILFSLYLIFIMLFPEAFKLFGISFSKILLIFTGFMILYKVIKIKKNQSVIMIPTFFKIYCFVFIVLSIIIFISNLFNFWIEKDFIINDLFEFLRCYLYIGVGFVFVLFYNDNTKIINKIFVITILINCAVAISQYFNFFNINELYVRAIAPTQYQTLVNGYPYPRVIGLTSNPNVFGMMITLSLIYTLYLLINNKCIKYKLLFLLQNIILFFTMSRTSYVCFVIGILFIIFFDILFTKKRLKYGIVTFLIFIILQSTLLFILPSNVTWRIKQLVDLSEITSWNNRLEKEENFSDMMENEIIPEENIKPSDDDEIILEENVKPSDENEIILEENIKPSDENETNIKEPDELIVHESNIKFEKSLNLFFGNGSRKPNEDNYFDNEYIFLRYHYGILGIGLIIISFLVFPVMNYRHNKIFSFLICLSLISLVYMYPAAIYNSYKLFPIWIILNIFIIFLSEKNNDNVQIDIKKVCHITSAHQRYDGRILKKECTSLAKKYETYLLCNDKLKNEIKDGVKIVSTNFKPKNRIERFFLSNKKILIKALELNADIYHLHDPELLNIALKLKKKNKIVIFDSHEDYPSNISQKKWIPKYLRKLVSISYEIKEKIVLKKIDAVVTVTNRIRDRIKKINKNTILITNYPVLNNKMERKDDGKTLCFAGGISKQWMHHNVIDAIKELDIKYIMAGDNNSTYFDTLKTLDGFKKVNAIGKISSNEVENLYSKSTIGIALNDYVANVGFKEGSLGNTKIFEYMMAELPLIATDFKVWKEIIEKNNCGLCVNPNDVDAIKNAIEYLINNPKEAKQMGKNGRKLVEEKYNWEIEEKELYKLYKKLEESYEKNSNNIRG